VQASDVAQFAINVWVVCHDASDMQFVFR